MILTVYDSIYCFFLENIKIGFPEYFNRVEFIENDADENSSEGDIDGDTNISDNDDLN